MTHDDLIAVLLLLGVSPVDVAAEGCLYASSIFMVLLEDGIEVESYLCHRKRVLPEPLSQYRVNTQCCFAFWGMYEEFLYQNEANCMKDILLLKAKSH